MDKRPIIGIVAKFTTPDDLNYIWRRQVFDGITRSLLIKNGANVIGILPQNKEVDFNDNDAGKYTLKMTTEEEKNLIDMLKLCDGIFLQSGENSDYYEEFTAKYCYENDIPLLGVCAGYNNIIRGLGGTTKANSQSHNKFGEDFVHKVKIEKGTLLYEILGQQEFMVNSIHSWVADKIVGLIPNCYSDDGLIEGVEAPDKKFYLGLKFHPELLVDKIPEMNLVFKQFVQKCKKQ